MHVCRNWIFFPRIKRWLFKSAQLCHICVDIFYDLLKNKEWQLNENLIYIPRTTLSQDVQTRSSVQLAFAKFLSKIKGNF